MVQYVLKWNIRPVKTDYADWAKSAIQRTLAVPGVVEFGAFRPLTGSHQVVIYYQFIDLAAWTTWRESEAVQQVFDELYEYGSEVEMELWGPSPVVPQPLRPSQKS